MSYNTTQSVATTSPALMCESTQTLLLLYQILQVVEQMVDNDSKPSVEGPCQEKEEELVHDDTKEWFQLINNMHKYWERIQNYRALQVSKCVNDTASLKNELEEYKLNLQELNNTLFAEKDSSKEITEPETNASEQTSTEEVCSNAGNVEKLNEDLVNATSVGNSSLVNNYLKCGADPNSAIHLAAYYGHLEIVQLLLDNGADVNLERKNDTWTPLHVAVQYEHLDVVHILLGMGARTDARRSDECTPLYQASALGNVQILQILLQYNASTELSCEKDFTPLQIAVQHGHLNVIRVLLSKGANKDVRKGDRRTPLCEASSLGNVQSVQVLLEYNASIELSCEKDSTPLHLAVHYGHPDVVRVLLSKGAKKNVRRSDGCTPLYQASASGNVQIVQILLEYDASTELSCEQQSAPLHTAVHFGHIDVVRELLRKGAGTNVRKSDGVTPLCQASALGNVQIVKMLLEYRASLRLTCKQYTSLHLAVLYNRVNVISVLLEHGADVNARDNDGRTGLFMAIQNRSLENVKLLIKYHADVNLPKKFQNILGWSPLHQVATYPNIEVAKALLQAGATVDVKYPSNNFTPLHYAAQFGNYEMVRLLVQNGANVRLRSKDGKTARFYAYAGGHRDIVNYLRSVGG